jgi:phosphoadenosine phosphosulfate reductase
LTISENRIEQLDALAYEYETTQPLEIIQRALQEVPNITLACSFGAEDMVLLDLLMQVDEHASVFYLDTDVLFDETYQLIERAKARYGLSNLNRVRPELTLDEQATAHGEALWARQPDQCCHIRKVVPLQKTLSAVDGWITGIRRDQAPTRAHAKVFEWDEKFELVKVNPLVRLTQGDVWNYIHEHDVPYNPLHDQGYPSIGCLHCTRAVAPGEDSRSGRWAGFGKTECGLHK